MRFDLTDAEWRVIEPLLPPRGLGKARVDDRRVLDAIFYILRTGAPWKDLPERYPPHQTCHRRFQAWCKEGVLGSVLRALARDLQERGGIDMSVCFVDGTFASAKGGAMASVRRSEARGPRSWRCQTALVFLSPWAWRALRRTRSRSSSGSSKEG